MKILLVEDDSDDAEFLRLSLLRHNARAIDITRAGTLGEAVQALHSARFDVVLLDYRLPDSDDLSLLSDVRRLSPGSAVVMMSAHGAPDVAAAAAALGAHGMIDKPFDVASIDTLLREASLIHRQGRAPRR